MPLRGTALFLSGMLVQQLENMISFILVFLPLSIVAELTDGVIGLENLVHELILVNHVVAKCVGEHFVYQFGVAVFHREGQRLVLLISL